MASIYRPRLIDDRLTTWLSFAGAILIEGPRACGKTDTGRHHSASSVELDVDAAALAMARLTPSLVLEGATPRLIDEWQLEPALWNHVRRAIDDRRAPGQFILTGSATPADDITRHSGAGRILRVRMRPMTLLESGLSSGAVSLAALMVQEPVAGAVAEPDIPALAQAICVGGWPGLQHLGAAQAQQFLRSYLDDTARVYIHEAGDAVPRRDPIRVRRLLTAYGRHIATPASLATLAADTQGADAAPLKPDTVSAYLTELDRIMVIEEQPSWAPHLRTRDRTRQAAIRHFADPSLAVAAMGAGPEQLLRDPNTLGLLFESLAIRDLRVYAQAQDGEVLHYRDSAGHEADAIILLRDGRWAAVEVKLGANMIDDAAASLTRLAAKIDHDKVGAPAALIVLTGGRYAYTRPDGIHVVPLATLRP